MTLYSTLTIHKQIWQYSEMLWTYRQKTDYYYYCCCSASSAWRKYGPKLQKTFRWATAVNPNMTVADVRRRGGTQCSLNDSQLRHWQAPDIYPRPTEGLWLLQIWMVFVLSATWDVSVSGWQAPLSAQGPRAACHASVYTKQNACSPRTNSKCYQKYLIQPHQLLHIW